MLKERILTALVLIPLVLWCIFGDATGKQFAAFAGAIVLVGAWEWTALMRWSDKAARAGFVLAVAISLVATSFFVIPAVKLALYATSALFWLVAVRGVVFYPESAVIWAKSAVLVPVGLILLIPAWVGLTDLQHLSPWWLMYVFGLVWGADTGAYFVGRAFGKHKLAPQVSPGKTIEGMVGGLLTTSILIVAVAVYRDLTLIRMAAFICLSLFTVLASVLGDLVESMVKRQAGVKDSGNIFPGHGGALDRIDSLTAAAPIFALGWWLAGGF